MTVTHKTIRYALYIAGIVAVMLKVFSPTSNTHGGSPHTTLKVLIYSQPEPDGVGDLIMAAFLARQVIRAQCHVGIYIDYSLYQERAGTMRQLFEDLVHDLKLTTCNHLATAQAWGAQRIVVGPGSNNQAFLLSNTAQKVLFVGEYGQPGGYREHLLRLEAAHANVDLSSAIREVITGFATNAGVVKLTPSQIEKIPTDRSWKKLKSLPSEVASAIQQGNYFLGYIARRPHKKNFVRSVYIYLATQLLRESELCVVILPSNWSTQDREQLTALLSLVGIVPCFHSLRAAAQPSKISELKSKNYRQVHVVTDSLSHCDFLYFMKGTKHPVLTTGDQSTGEAISLRKVFIYDLPYAHKTTVGQQLMKLHEQMHALILDREAMHLQDLCDMVDGGQAVMNESLTAKQIKGVANRIMLALQTPNLAHELADAFDEIPSLTDRLEKEIIWLVE